jgi:hypothetical protein
VTWSVTKREERRLRLSANRGPRRTFGPKREEVADSWRKAHNEKLLHKILFKRRDGSSVGIATG